MEALRLRSVLAASDLDRRSGFVVDAAGRLAAAMGAELHAIHALEMPSPDAVAARAVQEDVAFADRQLERQLERSSRGALEGSRTVALRAPHAAILERAREVAADLIVLGPHRGDTPGHFLGTTAARVMRRAGTPCLIVNAPLSLPLRRVVVGYDFSEAAEVALSAAVAWMAALGRPGPDGETPELTLVHVLRPLQVFGEYLVDVDEVADSLNDKLAERWDHIAGASAPRPTLRVMIRWSEPVDDAVARVAEAESADLLVVGSGRNGEARSRPIGGVASSIGRRAACPVLLVPACADTTRLGAITAGDDTSWPAAPAAAAGARRLHGDARQAGRRARIEAGTGPRPPSNGGAP